jgi:acetyl esterase
MLRTLLLGWALCATAAAADWRTDIEYANRGGESLTLDASIPDGKGPYPAVIIVHGGGFTQGNKGSFVTPLFPVFTNAGFVWFTINYRLAPKSHFPAPIEDAEDAVRWVKAHAAEYKVDPNRTALLGESAGGHIVAYIAATSGSKLGLKGVVPFYAPHDLYYEAMNQPQAQKTLRAFVGTGEEMNPAVIELLKQASPYYHVQKNMPSMLLIHGTADDLVAYEQSVRMLDKLRSAGVTAELYTVKDGNHGMGSWEQIPGGNAYKQYLVTWLRKTLQ